MSSNLSSSFHQFNFEVVKALAHSIYVFDGFRLDGDKMLLYRGELPTALPPKAVETLAVLVRNRGEIIGKEELIDAVWRGTAVEDSNLTQYLYLIRKTLGSRPDGRPYIETMRKRGYRFDSDIFQIETVGKIDDPTAPTARGGEFPAGHRGNVFALFDRKSEFGATEPVPSLTPKTDSRSRSQYGAIGVGLVGVFILATLFAVPFLSRSGTAVRNEAVLEQNVLRLTNGIELLAATVSPDGQYFVYLESGPEYRMWLQQTGYSSRVEIIPASEKALCCTAFSPDAEYVYYLAADPPGDAKSLFRVPKLGGAAARILTNISSAVSFSPDGREIVYSRYDKTKSGTEYVIRASDGSGEERVIYTASGPYSTPPAWSPDGKTIAFAESLSGEAGNYTLSVLNLADGSVSAVADESWDACHRIMWRADGSGFYFIGTKKGERLTSLRDQLYFVSYPEGRSRRITTDPTNRQQTDSLGVTNDGSVLTIPYNRSSQIWAMDANGDSRSAVQLTSGISDGRAGLAPLADGRLVYVARSADDTNIFVMSQDGSDQKALLADGIIPDEPRASLGSPYLVFSIYDWPYSHLFRTKMDGSETTQLTFGESRVVDSSISRDGKWVAYGRLAVPVKDEPDISLWKVPINGGDPIRLRQNNCLMPHFSPDDKMLSCVEDQKTIHILSAADGTQIRSFPAMSLAWLNAGARWTPDGKSVAYIVTEKGVSNIWLQPIDGKRPRRLTNFNIASIYNFAYSADGTRLFLARGTQIRDAVLISRAKN
jgi:DNA-binding winged helix-turn-helix (wHTH) protein/Tol biopolymer transport system component